MKWAYWNGKIINKKKTVLLCGVFETILCYRGHAVALKEHLRRLRGSGPKAKIKIPAQSLLKEAVEGVIKKNDLNVAALRLNVFQDLTHVNVYICARPYKLPSKSQYEKGFSAVLFRDEKISDLSAGGIKSLNRCFYECISERAKKQGCDEGFFLNFRGEVVEGSRTNIFLVKKNKIMTPGLDCGCLPGVTRGMVIKELKKRGIFVREQKIFPEDLNLVDEIFVTNSLLGIMPVTRLNKKTVGNGRAGLIAKTLGRNFYE